jgi:hypothetical protein
MVEFVILRVTNGEEEALSRHDSPGDAGQAMTAVLARWMSDTTPAPAGVSISYRLACIEDGTERLPTALEQAAYDAALEQDETIQTALRSQPDVTVIRAEDLKPPEDET